MPRGSDAKESKEHYDNTYIYIYIYIYIQTFREVQGILFEIESWFSMETITVAQCESGCLKCGVV